MRVPTPSRIARSARLKSGSRLDEVGPTWRNSRLAPSAIAIEAVAHDAGEHGPERRRRPEVPWGQRAQEDDDDRRRDRGDRAVARELGRRRPVAEEVRAHPPRRARGSRRATSRESERVRRSRRRSRRGASRAGRARARRVPRARTRGTCSPSSGALLLSELVGGQELVAPDLGGELAGRLEAGVGLVVASLRAVDPGAQADAPDVDGGSDLALRLEERAGLVEEGARVLGVAARDVVAREGEEGDRIRGVEADGPLVARERARRIPRQSPPRDPRSPAGATRRGARRSGRSRRSP
jgi:hypothetical protein